jgi:hypothetical protein
VFRKFTRIATTKTPLGPADRRLDPTDRRAVLADRAKGASPDELLVIARHLARLRNFRAASQLLIGVDTDELGFVDQCFVGTTLLSAQEGLTSDQFLAAHLDGIGERVLAPAEAVRLAEWIQLSGMPTADKLEALGAIRVARTIPRAFGSTTRDLRFREFRLRKAALEDVDVLEHFEGGEKDPYQWKDNLRYVGDLVTHGHAGTARALLERQLAQHGLRDRGVVEAALRFDSGSLIADPSAIPAEHHGAPGVLALAHDLRATSDAHEDLFTACLAATEARFPAMDVYARDSLLRVLTVKDLLDELHSLVPDLRGIPDTMLGARCGRGLIAMEQGAYRDAAGLLRSVLVEDPTYTAAATGLRFVYARLEGDYSVIDLRNEIGYGSASAGRAGIRSGDRDQATTLLLTGQYLKSWSVRRAAPPWRILKRDLGAKFLNYEELPEDPGSSLVLITDDGVGDEIRGAQYLAELASRYSVTATCDPRLHSLLERSFPTVRFVDVPRRLRGILNPVYDGRYSDFILASHLPAHCDPLVEAADHVTFGQNLTFNRFAGVLPRADEGAYLVPDPSRAVPRGTDSLKVGLVWKSHFASASRRMMYLGVERFAPLLDVEGVEFWSVQHATDPEEVAYCAEHGIRQIEDVDLFDDFEGLAGHLASMDLVIGISTVPMELAAAVGTPTWLLGFSPENYYYRTGGGATPVDQLSRNSTIVAPRWIDFSAPYEECVELVMTDCRSRLVRRARAQRPS